MKKKNVQDRCSRGRIRLKAALTSQMSLCLFTETVGGKAIEEDVFRKVYRWGKVSCQITAQTWGGEIIT